jgi:large subunit ribosomal protein L44
MLRTLQRLSSASRLTNTSIREYLCSNIHKASIHTSSTRPRGHNSREVRPVLYDIGQRRDVIELNNKLKEVNPIDRRSSFLDWNFEAELSALNGRLGESIPIQMLHQVFTTAEYIEEEANKQQQLNINIPLNLNSNEELSGEGVDLIDRVVASWLRGALPALPEEGVQAMKSYLTSEDLLADIGFHIGFKDLILAPEYPPLQQDFAKAFKAFVGALARTDASRAETFILDLIVTQLVGKDLTTLWDIQLPMRLLTQILQNQGRGEPESRLLWQLGPKTLLASFTVGVYSDKELIGEYSGESLEIAEEMAARDALRNLFKLDVSHFVLPVKQKFSASKPNPPIEDWTGANLPNLIIS